MDTIFFLLFLVSSITIFIFVILALINMKKDKEKSVKRWKGAGTSLALSLVTLIGFIFTAEKVDTTEQTTSEFSIQEENIQGSIWYVTLLTKDTDEDKLKTHMQSTINLAKGKEKKIDSIFVSVNIEDSLANSYAASGKVALSNTGLAQTGLKNVNEFEYNFSIKESHLMGKEDLPQSTASYNAQTILEAFQNAGLPTTDSRDNSHNCVDLECTSLITTEDVSIYEWQSTEKAQEIQNEYTFGDAQVGTIIIRMNNKSLDVQPYIDTLNNVINK